ncbi:hypothetical protein SGLAD_v1c00780 [Spiroplasma gladiatoris]|uniref:Uncharacterized protein n=1 Tax=Spiroplasma gladiatoris TaxID=2143 RepID=A0A4V1AQ51_9MOLU|nr:hypothetical protein [Spiroplasma gladiatoris]QBQ07279.1 hypothetical protein SGLAD_v1c00780 [Spiroplasma gladiatoris]
MKKKILVWSLIFSFFILVISNFASNASFFAKKADKSLDNQIRQKLRIGESWPVESKEYLSIWEKMHRQATKDLNDIVQKINKSYMDNYLNLLFYYIDNPYVCNQDCDNRGVPNFEIEKIYKEACESEDIQLYAAQLLKSIYIEARINKIKEVNYALIDNNEFQPLWTLKYFNAIIYYESIREWNDKLWQIVGFALDINFYTFGAYVNSWEEGPSAEDVENYPPDIKVKVNPLMLEFIDDLYNYVFLNRNI